MADADPEQLRILAEQLAALSFEDQELVISAARRQGTPVLRPVPWEHLRKATGIIALGGDAVEDCKALYDDV